MPDRSSRPRRLLVLRHGPTVGPDRLVAVLDALAGRLDWREHDLTVDPAVPSLDTFDALLVLGGQMNTDDADAWLGPERVLLRDAVGNGVPVVGVCLGAQQLAVALGGEVAHRDTVNAAVSALSVTEDGRAHDVVGIWSDGAPAVFHNGCEVAVLPPGARLVLDGGEGASAGWVDATDTAVAVQFHPEVGPATVRTWEERGDGEVDEALLELVEQQAEAIHTAGAGLVRLWLEQRVLGRHDLGRA